MIFFRIDDGVPVEVGRLDFSKPIIFHLPDKIQISNLPCPDNGLAAIEKDCQNAKQILLRSSIKLDDYNIYTLRSNKFAVDNTVTSLNNSPNTYYSPHCLEILEKLSAGIDDSDRIKYLQDLRLRYSSISFFGFSFGSVLAEMLGNALKLHLIKEGYTDEDVKSVTDCTYNTSTGAVVNFLPNGGNMNSVHSVHYYDKDISFYTDDRLAAEPELAHGALEQKRFGSSLVITSFEVAPVVNSIKFTPNGPVIKTNELDHHPFFYHSAAAYDSRLKLLQFPTNHASHIVAESIRAGAESSTKAFKGETRNSAELIDSLQRKFLVPTAMNVQARHVWAQEILFRNLARGGIGQRSA